MIDGRTKISFATGRAIFPFQPRDTVTHIAERAVPEAAGGGTALLLRAVEHPAMRPRKSHVRAKVLRGMHLIQPVRGAPHRTNFTLTQHIDTGGVVPAWLMNTILAQDAVLFVKRLSAASAKRRGGGG